MGKALYRKYRSKKLSEVVGQEHITTTLENALKKGQLSHAYLLTGPRGVGKTSIARILAHEVNGLSYDDDSTHLDIIEIDAASNRRIDEIRDLKERVNIAPTSAKYKVYIIDEVHMLTKEAFNALLKTLEEPPEHVIFVLATTEAHKVPETIQSRTQRFTLKPISMEQVVAHLKDIAKQEKVTIDDAALELIAQHGEGSFRDSISLLDQVRHSGEKIRLDDVRRAVGQAPDDLLQNVVTAIASHDAAAVALSLSDLQVHGIQPAQVSKQLSKLLRQSIIDGSSVLGAEESLELLGELLLVSTKPDPALSLELALYQAALKSQSRPVMTASPQTAPIPTIISQSADKPHKPKQLDPVEIESDARAEEPDETPDTNPEQPIELNDSGWQEVLNALKGSHNTLYGIARMAVPKFDDDKLTLTFAFAFHQKRMDAHKKILEDTLFNVTNARTQVICILEPGVEKPHSDPEPVVQTVPNEDLQNVSNIFGGAEIVE